MEIRKARKEDMKAVQDLRYLLCIYEKEIGATIGVTDWLIQKLEKKIIIIF